MNKQSEGSACSSWMLNMDLDVNLFTFVNSYKWLPPTFCKSPYSSKSKLDHNTHGTGVRMSGMVFCGIVYWVY